MCLAIPAQITALQPPDRATVVLSGTQKDISVALLDEVAVGDFVVVHVGFAIAKLDQDEANALLADWAAMDDLHPGRVPVP